MTALRKDGVLTGAAVHAADRFRVFRSLALRRPHVEARRLHGRRRLRPVARQLPDARADRGAAGAGGGAAPAHGKHGRAAGALTGSADHQLWIEAFVAVQLRRSGRRHLPGALDEPVPPSDANTSRCSFLPPPPLALAAVVPLRRRCPAVWRDVGYLVGWLAVVVGLAGVILHLDSQFFYERTIRSLTYAAPFAAPLAYTGLGLLLIVNRMVEPDAHRVGAVGAAAGARRLRRQLRLQPDRPRAERLLQSARVGAGREQRVRGRLPARAVRDATVDAAVLCAVRGRAGRAGAGRRRRVRACTSRPTCASRAPRCSSGS